MFQANNFYTFLLKIIIKLINLFIFFNYFLFIFKYFHIFQFEFFDFYHVCIDVDNFEYDTQQEKEYCAN